MSDKKIKKVIKGLKKASKSHAGQAKTLKTLLIKEEKEMSLIASLIGPVSGILDKLLEDNDQKAALAHEIATMSDSHAQQALLAQLEINKAEAAFW